jgi:hypothetical protein
MVFRESASLAPRLQSRFFRSGKTVRLNAFSLVTLISNIFSMLMSLIFGDMAFYYYIYIAMNLSCLFLWFIRGQRIEDVLALSTMFLTIFVLAPAPLNAVSHFVFWGSPELYASLTSGPPYLCAVFLATASVPTLVGQPKPRIFSAQKFNLNWTALFFCMSAMVVYLAMFPSVFFSLRIELELQSAEAGLRALTGLLVTTLPRGIAFAVFLCVITYVFGHLTARSPVLDISLLGLCLLVCLIYFYPLAIPRQTLLAGGLSAFYYLSWFGILNRKWLIFIIPVAAFIVGPAISNITRFELTSDYFPTSPDFDCFQSMNVGLDVINVDGLKWGGNLLASLSFFLPSELKFFNEYHLMESPHFADLLEASNISMPLPVDLYADFGTLGLIAETFLIFWYLRFAYGRIETSKTESQRIYRIGTISILLGCWPSLMRGPLLGNSPVVLMFLIAWFLICRLLDGKRMWGFRLSKARG